MKIYIATPVNGRKEKTLDEKRKAAEKRVQEIVKYLKPILGEEHEYISSFTFWPTSLSWDKFSEAEVMGACVTMVMESDLVILDDNISWNSKGMIVESYTARIYGIKVRTLKHYQMMEQVDGLCRKIV